MKNSERIYGLDLLKILLVFGVIFLHLIGKVELLLIVGIIHLHIGIFICYK